MKPLQSFIHSLNKYVRNSWGWATHLSKRETWELQEPAQVTRLLSNEEVRPQAVWFQTVLSNTLRFLQIPRETNVSVVHRSERKLLAEWFLVMGH